MPRTPILLCSYRVIPRPRQVLDTTFGRWASDTRTERRSSAASAAVLQTDGQDRSWPAVTARSDLFPWRIRPTPRETFRVLDSTRIGFSRYSDSGRKGRA